MNKSSCFQKYYVYCFPRKPDVPLCKCGSKYHETMCLYLLGNTLCLQYRVDVNVLIIVELA